MSRSTTMTPAKGSGPSADFSDLLHSAEQLTAEFELVPDFADLPRVERNLVQLVEAGQQLFSKTSRTGDVGGQEVKAAVLLGSRGVDLPGLQQRLQSLTSKSKAGAQRGVGTAAEPLEPLRDTDIAGFLRNERETALLSVIEETRKDTFEYIEKMHRESMGSEWESEKQRILQSLSGVASDRSDIADMSYSLRSEISRIHENTMGIRSTLDNVEMIYANAIGDYNSAVVLGQHGAKPDVVARMSALFPEEEDQEAFVLWEMVKSMGSLKAPNAQAQVAKWRNNEATKKQIVQNARGFLEDTFRKFVETTVYSNLRQAQLGGVPGTFHLVRSFINVKIPSNAPGLEQGLVDGAPVWAMIFYCLRCGDLQAALQAASQAGPALTEMASLLSELSSSPDRRLTPHSENVVRLAYRRAIRSTSDPFKRAVYCLLGACDPADEHSEIANSLDDYLWIKLYQIREENQDSMDISFSNRHMDILTLRQLQHLLSEEYGEAHFNAYEQPVLYFQVLFLTAQFEAAIEFLFRIDRLRSHAVHIALALFEKNLLVLSTNVQAALLSKESSLPETPRASATITTSATRRLNIARLIILYARKFESTDPKEALQYFFFLRDLRGVKGENLYISSVSELVLESRDFDLLLGKLNENNGVRSPGLIDRLQASSEETQKIIEAVAADSEQKGMLEDSVRLYDLAGNHERVIQILNKLIAQVVSQPAVAESKRDRLQRQAVDIAKRYRALGHSASKESIASLYLLLDLMTFFDLYHGKRNQDALETLERIKIVPFSQSEVSSCVSTFRELPEEIRRNISDVLLACMTILFTQFKQAKTAIATSTMRDQNEERKKSLEIIKSKAKSLISFAGVIPYRMPGDTNGRLVQMEILMN